MTSHSILINTLDRDLNNCLLCQEAGHQITPGAVFSHPRNGQVMLIGQAPGITEVEARRPFNAGSGRRLFQWLGDAGWQEEEFRARQVMTAVTKCYPGKGANGKGDRVPSKKEQQLCRPYLEREIKLFNPRVIIPVGGLAIKLFFSPAKKLSEIIGTAVYYPAQAVKGPLKFDKTRAVLQRSLDGSLVQDGLWIVPLPHPSGASLWPNKRENQILIKQAVDILNDLRQSWSL